MISKLHTDVSTADQLWELPADGKRYELIGGKLQMMSPAGNEHGRIAMAIGASLFQHVKVLQLGKTYAAETGFLIARDPDTVRAPDAAFVSTQRLASVEASSTYLELAPDLVVEVVSPNDVFSDVEEKVSQWLAAGSKIVLVANPKDASLRIYRLPEKIEILRQGDCFDAGDVCGNWNLNVSDVFE